MHRVLIVFPTDWDRKQLAACEAQWRDRYEILYAQPNDVDCPWNYDVLSFIDRAVEEYGGRIDGVFSSSDYPGATVAAAIATRLGLPGSQPETIIRCSHKFYSRIAQQEAVPEATPWFALLDPADLDLSELQYPCFVKPVKGAFSIMSRRIASPEELQAFLASGEVAGFLAQYLEIFDRLVANLTTLKRGGRRKCGDSSVPGGPSWPRGSAGAGSSAPRNCCTVPRSRWKAWRQGAGWRSWGWSIP